VSSLQPRPGYWLLRCPLCKSGFTEAAGALVCRNGHSFDLAREGYVNLHPVGDAARPRAATVGRNFAIAQNFSMRATSTPWRRWSPLVSRKCHTYLGTS
jgi:hypothetical protein